MTHPSTPSKTARQRTREILVLASSTGPPKGPLGAGELVVEIFIVKIVKDSKILEVQGKMGMGKRRSEL